MLEAQGHEQNAFIGLSYSDDNLPDDGSLRPDHLKNFLKRLRKAVSPVRFRFFACGEYGDQSFRPHYHVILFGLPSCSRGLTAPNHRGICCDVCSLYSRVWGLGFVHCGQLTEKSAAYCANYTIKKLTGKEVDQYSGRLPEFSRSSNRPGLGADQMWEVASVLMEHKLDSTLEDVPSALRHGSKILPLGRYLTRKLRKYCGKDERTPTSVIQKRQEELRPLREAAYAIAAPGFKEQAFRQEIIKLAEPKEIQAKRRYRRTRKSTI